MAGPRRWSGDEVEEILRRAIERQQASDARKEGTSHEDLLAAAREVGIDPAAVDAAAADLEKEKEKEPEPEPKALATRSPRRRFLRSFAIYAMVNSILLGVDLATGPGFWVQWVALGWGIGLAFRAAKIFFPTEDDLEAEKRRAARKAERAQRRAAKQARREARREKEREFEEAVEAGVTALLGAAARRIRKELDARPQVRVAVAPEDAEEVEAWTSEEKKTTR